MEEKIHCLLCGKKTALLTTTQKGYQEPDLFSIYCCDSCNTSFSLPRVETSSIYQLIYECGDKVSGYDRYWNYLNTITGKKKPIEYLANSEPCYWATYQAISTNLKLSKGAKILEVGSGLGYLTYSLRKTGFSSVHGLDISQEAVNKANETLGDYYVCADICQYTETHMEEFDAVILTEVIEHIENPVEFIKLLTKLLKIGGSIIMTTPNKSFYPSLCKWRTDSPPVHCWWFSEKTFEYIAEKQSLSISFVDFTEYYKKHLKVVYNTKNHKEGLGWHRFDKDKKLTIPNKVDIVNQGFLPLWMKKNLLYKIISTYLYPIFSKDIVVSGNRTDVLCVILTKNAE